MEFLPFYIFAESALNNIKPGLVFEHESDKQYLLRKLYQKVFLPLDENAVRIIFSIKEPHEKGGNNEQGKESITGENRSLLNLPAERQNAPSFHLDRAARCNSDHCHSGGDAAACAEQGQGNRQGYRLCQQNQFRDHHAAELFR